MQLSLAGQSAIVTGGSTGIGLAVARAYADAGAAVAVDYMSNASSAEAFVDAVTAGGGRAMAVRADVSSEDDVHRLFEQAVTQWGTVDIVVANAGLQDDAAFKDMTLAQWKKVIDVNLTGQFVTARAAIREFIRRGRRPEVSKALGKIICMGSVHQVIPWGGHVNYATSKGGVTMLMKSLAQEVAGLGIRVNAIGPGAIRTNINRPAWDNEAALNKLLKLIPYARIGEPEDVAKVALWLASDESDYVTGTTLFVDGGMCLYPGFADNG
ncbi:MAG: glucose 1-dehydrogenase [Pseudomonadota bacterium]|nr:glucose 1-dehydrogenase [Pseudomonadota bacterium]